MTVDQNLGHRHSNLQSHTATGIQIAIGIPSMKHAVGPSVNAEGIGCNRCDVVSTQKGITDLQSLQARAFPPSICIYVVILEEANKANLVLVVSVPNEIHHVRHRPLIKKMMSPPEGLSRSLVLQNFWSENLEALAHTEKWEQ